MTLMMLSRGHQPHYSSRGSRTNGSRCHGSTRYVVESSEASTVAVIWAWGTPYATEHRDSIPTSYIRLGIRGGPAITALGVL